MAILDNVLYMNTASIAVFDATGSNLTGVSFLGTSSAAISSSYANISKTAVSSSWASASISSSYSVTSSFASISSTATSSSFAISASWAPSQGSSTSSSWASASISSSFTTTASFAVTASYYKMFSVVKSGIISASLFAGSPLVVTASFVTPMPNTIYAVSIVGGDARNWTVEYVSASNFTISTNSSQALTDYVRWTAIGNGESV